MTRRMSLSDLAALVQQTIEDRFEQLSFWVTAEIADVRKYELKQWCFCKCVEKRGTNITTEMQAVFWNTGYQHILRFEKLTGRPFTSGIEVSCRVMVKFHEKFGLKLEVLEIDHSFMLGQLEMERRLTIEKLLASYPTQIRQEDDEFITFNNQLKLPLVLQRIALITAMGSDGQRDFMQELARNSYAYDFAVTGFLTTIQGQNAAANLVGQLQAIRAQANDFDLVALVRGGGSDTDFKPFDDFEVARTIALFPIPVFTGIGHDRNHSIADMMARRFKTPTKVASAIIDHNLRFENQVMALEQHLDEAAQRLVADSRQGLAHLQQRLQWKVPQMLQQRRQTLGFYHQRLSQQSKQAVLLRSQQLERASQQLDLAKTRYLKSRQDNLGQLARLVHHLSPVTTLQRGYAMLMQDQQIITTARQLQPGLPMKATLADGTVDTQILNIKFHEQSDL